LNGGYIYLKPFLKQGKHSAFIFSTLLFPRRLCVAYGLQKQISEDMKQHPFKKF
jgi:hypothetical protein